MSKTSTLRHIQEPSSSLPAKEEAIAVLMEMERLAEQRLIEASNEFQDIAHEMEWRLLDWTRLCDERLKLEKQLDRAQCATPRFNLRARILDDPTASEQTDKSEASGEETSPQKRQRKDNWAKMVALLCERLERNIVASEETLEAITSRNEEGDLLQKEIFELQEKIRRIGQNLRRMEKPHAIIVREGDAAEALARLGAAMGGRSEDLPDPATLITAACAVGRGVAGLDDKADDF